MTKNTVLLIEPRMLEHLSNVIKNSQEMLGESWNYVFYCGKNTKHVWEKHMTGVDIRELPVENFQEPRFYNDFLKSKELWESLEGEFVLTIQADTWIMEHCTMEHAQMEHCTMEHAQMGHCTMEKKGTPKYTIDYFINLNKSFIGGNCEYRWHEFDRENIQVNYPNFNGGLSLRKRGDLLKIIDTFPPEPTETYGHDSKKIQTDAEDVYFVLGAKKLGLSVGDTEDCQHFAVHSYYVDGFFGIHNPYQPSTKARVKEIHPELVYLNPYLQL
jgi:hypothetical protein